VSLDVDGDGTYEATDALRLTPSGGLIGVDANQDGTITFNPMDSSKSDRTSLAKPYRFWLNNDDDGDQQDGENEVLPGDPGFEVDSLRPIIQSKRDQEDWARLVI